LLTTQALDADRRATGVGMFSAFTSAGYAIGSLVGGLLVTHLGSGQALGILAVLQLCAIPLLRRKRVGGEGIKSEVEPPFV
jgi:predicted MFS family arabinose efflux permease